MGRDNLNFAAIIALSENKVKYYEDGRVGGNISETVNNSGRPHHQNAFSKTKKNRRLSEICQTEEVRFIHLRSNHNLHHHCNTILSYHLRWEMDSDKFSDTL